MAYGALSPMGSWGMPSKLFLTNRLELKKVTIIYKTRLSYHPLLAKMSAQKHAFGR